MAIGGRVVRADNATRPELLLQLGHRGIVMAVAISPDGQTVASAGTDGNIRLWNCATGELQRVLPRRRNKVSELVFTPDGHSLMSLGTGEEFDDVGELLLWDIQTGTVRRTLASIYPSSPGFSFGPFALSRDGRSVALIRGSDDRQGASVEILDLANGKIKRTLARQPAQIFDIAFNANSENLVTSCADGLVKSWNIATGRVIQSVKAPYRDHISVAVSPVGKIIAAAAVKSEEMTAATAVVLWDAVTGREVRTMAQGGIVVNPIFSPDGKTLISGGGMLGVSQIQFWDTDTGKTRRTLTGRSDAVLPFCLSADGRTLITADFTPMKKGTHQGAFDFFGGDLQIFDTVTGDLTKTLRGFRRHVDLAAYSTDGQAIVEMGDPISDRTTLKPSDVSLYSVWSAHTGRFEPLPSGKMPFKFLPNGTAILLKSSAKPATHKFVIPKVLQARVARSSIAWMPDGSAFVVPKTSEFMEKTELQLYDARTGKLKRTLKLSENDSSPLLGTMLFTADGKSLLARTEESIYWWDVKTGKLLRSVQSDAKIAEMEIGVTAGTMPLVLSPDGRILANETSQRTIQLRDFKSGRLLHTLAGHDSAVRTLNFLPDSKSLVSGSTDGSTKVWRVADGTLRVTLIRLPPTAPPSSQRGTAFSVASKGFNWIAHTPDGYYQASPGAKEFIRWRVGNTLYPAANFKSRDNAGKVRAAMTR